MFSKNGFQKNYVYSLIQIISRSNIFAFAFLPADFLAFQKQSQTGQKTNKSDDQQQSQKKQKKTILIMYYHN